MSERPIYLGLTKGFEECHYGKYVEIGAMVGNPNIDRIGKLIQIRLKCGAWGTDVVLIRHSDGNLTSHENQSFKLIQNAELISKLDKEFAHIDCDSIDEYYSIGKGIAYKGFLIDGLNVDHSGEESFSIVTYKENQQEHEG